jgi:hypothetical protein
VSLLHSQSHRAEAKRCRLLAKHLSESASRVLLLKMATLYDTMAAVATKREAAERRHGNTLTLNSPCS